MMKYKLGELLEYEQPTKYIVDSTDYSDEYSIPVLTAGQSFILGYTSETHNVYENVPVIIFDDFTTSIQYVDFPFKVKSSAMKILKNTEKVDLKFMYFLLSTIKVDTGLHKRYWISKFADMEVEIPGVAIQKEIVCRLEKIAGIIKKKEKEMVLLDELVKAQFVELFGDPETNPYGWEKVTVGEVCSSIVRGPFGSALKKEFFVEPDETTYKVYEQKHAIQKSATIGTYYVTAEKFGELRRFECVAGDILMSCSGTMGELYQLPEGCEKGLINQALCKFTLNERILPIVFLTYMKQTIGNLETKGSGIQNIAAVSYVKAMPINLASMEVQEQFAAFVKQTDKSKVAIQKSLDEMQQLYDKLMQEYFG